MSDIPIGIRESGDFSPAVESIFTRILTAIHNGELEPGQHIQDFHLAQRFAVSRTPVREAIQRLRDIGVIEAVAGRFTRVAEVDTVMTSRSVATWCALYRGIVADVATRVPPQVIELMTADRRRYEELLPGGDYRAIACASFDFFNRLVPVTTNRMLAIGLDRVSQIARICLVNLPETVDTVALEKVQTELLDALSEGDRPRALAAIDMLQDIPVPPRADTPTWRSPH